MGGRKDEFVVAFFPELLESFELFLGWWTDGFAVDAGVSSHGTLAC
jgi:hypothetical protein